MIDIKKLIKTPEKFDITKIRNVGKLPIDVDKKLSNLDKDISTDTLKEINEIFPNTIGDTAKKYKNAGQKYRVARKSVSSTTKSIVANIKNSTKESKKLVDELNKI